MSSLQRLPKTALVLICDARKALFVGNAGTEIHPVLEIIATIEAEPHSAELDLKGNRPGRMPDSRPGDGSHGPKSAMEEPDYARRDEEEFAASVAEEVSHVMKGSGKTTLVTVASARMLGALRQAMSPEVRESVLAEVPKTLTQLPLDELPGHLVDAW